jgi:hypothetical protein
MYKWVTDCLSDMSKTVKLGLVKFSDSGREGIYRVEIFYEFPDGRVLIKPRELVEGNSVLFDDYNQFVQKEKVTDIIEKTVSNWKYFWDNY